MASSIQTSGILCRERARLAAKLPPRRRLLWGAVRLQIASGLWCWPKPYAAVATGWLNFRRTWGWIQRLAATVFLGPMVLQSFHGPIHPFWIVGTLHDRLSRKILMFGSPVVSERLEVAHGYQFLDGYGFEIENISRSPVIDFTGKNPQVQEGKLVTVNWLILIWWVMRNHFGFLVLNLRVSFSV
jgi:hypothetical protein